MPHGSAPSPPAFPTPMANSALLAPAIGAWRRGTSMPKRSSRRRSGQLSGQTSGGDMNANPMLGGGAGKRRAVTFRQSRHKFHHQGALASCAGKAGPTGREHGILAVARDCEPELHARSRCINGWAKFVELPRSSRGGQEHSQLPPAFLHARKKDHPQNFVSMAQKTGASLGIKQPED